MQPIYGFTTGWLPSPPNPILDETTCEQNCNPYCEPGFCDKLVPMPFSPVGYFAEFKRFLTEFSRPNDVMSIGQTAKPYGSTGQWAVKYVDEDPSTMVQDDIVLKRSINDPNTIKYGASLDMWNSFLGPGVSFLQGNTLHRAWWYPNGPPGQIKNPLDSAQNFIPIDSCYLNSPGLDFGMISSNGSKITTEMCINNVNKFLEYLDLMGDIPSIQWVPPSKYIAKRFNFPGRTWSGYLETSSTKAGNPDTYYIEFSRTDFGTNFAFTGNWIDIFEGAGLFYKYKKTIIAPNKCGAVFKLFWRAFNSDANVQELARRIIGVDYYNNNLSGEHNPVQYQDGKLYSNQVGVTQGMCMGSSLPGRTGQVILDSSNPDSGASLWYDAWKNAGNGSNENLIYLGMVWLLCNSPVHSPNNNTTYVGIFADANGISSKTWSFFSYWANARNFDIRTPKGLLTACKTFILICAMGSGGHPAENYLVNAWQNTTVCDTIMFTLAMAMDYDLIQLTMDVTENNLWTRESMAMTVPPDLVPIAKKQIFAQGPHGGSLLLFILQFGTKYTISSPVFVGKNIVQNPTSFDRNPDTNINNWIPKDNPLGPVPSLNKGDVVTDSSSRFVSNSDFNKMLFTYYSENDIITLRDPTDLTVDQDIEWIRKQTSINTSMTYGRTVTEAGAYSPDGTRDIISYDPSIPPKRRSQRCFGDWCAILADNTQTRAWGRQATGYSFG